MNDNSKTKPLTRGLDTAERIAGGQKDRQASAAGASVRESLIALLVFTAFIGLICFLA